MKFPVKLMRDSKGLLMPALYRPAPMLTSEEVWVPWEADPEIRGWWVTWLMWTVNPVGRWRM